MDQSLINMVRQVVASAHLAGLGAQEQRDAAVAAVWAATPDEAPAIAHLMVELLYPEVADMAA